MSTKLGCVKSLDETLSNVETLDLHIKHLLLNKESLNIYKSQFSSIEENLSKINTKLDEFISVRDQNTDSASASCNTESILSKIDSLLSHSSNTSSFIPGPGSTSHPEVSSINHGEEHVYYSRDDFIVNSHADKLLEFLSTCEFESEGGRQVKAFGEPYKYNGSNLKPDEFPEIIEQLIDNLNSEFCSDSPKLNSCLINKFEGPDSCLAEHSDNELSIAPESSIFTVSLGDSCTIKFREEHTGKELVHQCPDRSLYVMSRRSQEHFKHKIDPGEIKNVRYSLTFRCVSWRYFNSTLLIGDSNTGKLKFCDGIGTFGKATPGLRAWAPLIKDIDPNIAAGYSNIVVLCGINDIRHSSIKSQTDVHKIYVSLKHKIELVQHTNSRAKIFICKLLPTRLQHLNNKVNYFNSLLYNDLVAKNYNISLVSGFMDFVDEQGLLAAQFCNDGDYLHLNTYAVRILGNKIKTEIFCRKRKHGGTVMPKLQYTEEAWEVSSSHQT